MHFGIITKPVAKSAELTVSFGPAEKTLPNPTAAAKLVLKLMAKTLDRAYAIGYNIKAAEKYGTHSGLVRPRRKDRSQGNSQSRDTD